MITNWTLKYCIPCSQRWASLSRRAKENTKYTDFHQEEKSKKEEESQRNYFWNLFTFYATIPDLFSIELDVST